MNLISNRTRVTIALAAVLLAGVVALIIRVADNGDPGLQAPASFDTQPDLVEGRLTTTSPEPTESPAPAPRRRTGGTRGGSAPKPEPQPEPSDLSQLSDLPAVPDKPPQPPAPETP